MLDATSKPARTQSPPCRQTANSPPPTRRCAPSTRRSARFSSAIKGARQLYRPRFRQRLGGNSNRDPTLSLAGRAARPFAARRIAGGSEITRRRRDGPLGFDLTAPAISFVLVGEPRVEIRPHRLAIELDHHLLHGQRLAARMAASMSLSRLRTWLGSRTKSSAQLARPRTTWAGLVARAKFSANYLCHCTADRVRQNQDVGAPVQTAECQPAPPRNH